MTRRRKTLLVVLAAVVLTAGGFAWWWQATAVDRQVNTLLDEVRREEPWLVKRWLIKLGLAKQPAPARTQRTILNDLVVLGPPAVGPLIEALKDEHPVVRYCAAMALDALGDARAIEPLAGALNKENASVRRAAALGLARLGDSRGIELVIKTLGDTAYAGSAAHALVALGDPRGFEPLVAALREGDANLGMCAADALGELKDPRAVGPLMETFRRSYPPGLHSSAANALAKLGPAACAPLVSALKDWDWRVRISAAEALGKLGDKRAVQPLLAALKDERSDVRAQAAMALGKLRDPQAFDALVAATRSDYVVQCGAVTALGDLGDPRAIEVLERLLADEKEGSAVAAAKIALQKLRSKGKSP